MLLQNVQDEFAEIMQAETMHSDLCIPATNMTIYRQNRIANLVHTLLATYSNITKLVGENFFRITAKEYIRRYPSLSGNLHDYGEYFGDFLAHYAPVSHLPYLTEVAQFEWSCHLLHFASDANSLDIKSLESVSPDQFQQLHFHLHPASRLIRFHYPILRIVHLCKDENDEEVSLDEEGVHLLLIRRDLKLVEVQLAKAEFTFLQALSKNETLGKALDEAIENDPEFKLDNVLPKWIQNKTIVGFSL